MVFDTVIQRNTKISEAPSHQQTILDYDIESRGAKDYMLLAEEVNQRIENWNKEK